MFKLFLLIVIISYLSQNFKILATTIFIFILIKTFPYLLSQIMDISEHRRYLKSTLAQLDQMTGHEFESYLEAQFYSLGYKTKNIGYNGNDFGIDLLLYKDGIKIAVQAKRYNGNVGIKAIQEAVAGQQYYDADEAWVITTGYFTKSAQKLSQKCNVILWDRDDCEDNFMS